MADQLGRLDFISALLAVIALLLGLGAIPLFFHLRTRAKEAAEAALKDFLEGLEERIEKEAVSKMEEMLPTLVAQYEALAGNSVTGTEADAIAGAQDTETADEHISDHSGGAAGGAG